MAAKSASAGSFGHENHEYYDRHRFDNYSAWLDREGRSKNRAEGKPSGFGYATPKAPQAQRKERPFWIGETSMTSGTMVHRKYDQKDCDYPLEAQRSDPWHYPNHMEIQDNDHYKDHSRRNCHADPRRWVVDPKLRDAVSDASVQAHVKSNRGETLSNADPNILAILFGDNIRPQPATVKELNCDLSCIDLPEREAGPRPKPSPGNTRGSGFVLGVLPEKDPLADSKWGWCTGGRKQPSDPRSQYTPEQSQMLRSQSLPQALSGPSMLPGADGSPSSPYFGASTRRFGKQGGWDGRMRGQKLARNGWAGTYPEKEARFF